MQEAKSQNNPNKEARAFWIETERLLNEWRLAYENKYCYAIGLDFSDHEQVWEALKHSDSKDNADWL